MDLESKSASVIVPAFREAANITALTERLFAAAKTRGWTIELIIVDDDSRDGTEEIVADLSKRYDVRVIVRRGERGLSSAVLAGFANAKHERLAVMDADLQHPPEIIPSLLERLCDPDCDFVIATRYAQSGGINSDWPMRRRLASKLGTIIALPLARLSDPMSGCFALTKTTLARARRLDPLGYKIALELYVKCGCRRPCEVPMQFAARTAGESKASFAEGVRFLRHLGRLYRFRFLRRWGSKTTC
jgi:dolichol-phosphate mannosyltransferase